MTPREAVEAAADNALFKVATRAIMALGLPMALSFLGWLAVSTAALKEDMAVVKVQMSGLKEQMTLTYTAVAAAGDNALRNQRDAEQDRRIEALESARRRAASAEPM